MKVERFSGGWGRRGGKSEAGSWFEFESGGPGVNMPEAKAPRMGSYVNAARDWRSRWGCVGATSEAIGAHDCASLTALVEISLRL